MAETYRDATRAVSRISSHLPDLEVFCIEEKRMAAQLVHADFERDMGPCRGLLGRDQWQGTCPAKVVRHPGPFWRLRRSAPVQDLVEFDF